MYSKVGVVVATPVLPNGAMQQWMCDAVVPATKPVKFTCRVSRCAAGSVMMNALPMPGDGLAGFSEAPLRLTLKRAASVIGASSNIIAPNAKLIAKRNMAKFPLFLTFDSFPT